MQVTGRSALLARSFSLFGEPTRFESRPRLATISRMATGLSGPEHEKLRIAKDSDSETSSQMDKEEVVGGTLGPVEEYDLLDSDIDDDEPDVAEDNDSDVSRHFMEEDSGLRFYEPLVQGTCGANDWVLEAVSVENGAPSEIEFKRGEDFPNEAALPHVKGIYFYLFIHLIGCLPYRSQLLQTPSWRFGGTRW